MLPALGVICREPLEIDESGVKLKSALLAALKLGYANCRELLQVLLQSMTKAAQTSCKIERLMILWPAMACKLFLQAYDKLCGCVGCVFKDWS
jgi:hypothetical protein